ncbi:MAG: ABC transporter permease [Thermoanaerobaculia bacterium]|nr:ABC transporter permease [Thermoanaerobaculia bacterium]
MTRLAYDLRFAFRSMAKRPFFSLLVVVILGLGLGATTAVVDLANLLAWRPVPASNPGELVKVFTAAHRGFIGPYHATGFADYEDYRDAAQSFSGLVASDLREFRVDTGEATELLWSAGVTGNYFDVLGIRPSNGRVLSRDDDVQGAERVVVLAYHLWQRLGSDPEILGRIITIEGHPFTVVGVGPTGFRGTIAANPQDLYLPLAAVSALLPDGEEHLSARGRGSFEILGRLATGRSIDEAQSELAVLAGQLDQEHPTADEHPRQVTVTEADLVHPVDVERLSKTLQLFAIAVGLLLLITCANVAHLLLGRATVRRREMAVRLSIGAGRRALVRQLLTESLVLALAGGVLGLAVARVGRTFVSTIAGPEFSVEMVFDGRVLAATFAVCLVVTLLFGLVPALTSVRVDLTTALKDGSNGAGRRRFVAGNLLGAGQVALSVVLLAAGALLVQSLQNRLGADLGFDDEQIAIARLTLPDSEYSLEDSHDFFRRYLDEVRALPGVESAGVGLIIPPILFDINVPVRRPGEDQDAASPRINFADPEYFETMGIELRRGRMFDGSDTIEGPSAVLVNELLAEKLFPGEAPVGRRIQVQGRPHDPGPDHVIVGVVENVTQMRATEGGEPTMYFSWSQRLRSSRQLVVRSSLDPAAVFDSLRTTLRELDPHLALSMMRTGPANRRNALAVERMQAQAVAVFAVFGFLLAVVGIFGVLTYSVSHRVREIGIRMAVGARGSDVLRQVVGQGLALAMAGAAIGLATTLLAASYLETLLYGVAARDLGVLAVVLAVVFFASTCAAYLPARRASRLDPLTALRHE